MLLAVKENECLMELASRVEAELPEVMLETRGDSSSAGFLCSAYSHGSYF